MLLLTLELVVRRSVRDLNLSCVREIKFGHFPFHDGKRRAQGLINGACRNSRGALL